jgi:hypothetical protein
MICRSLANQNDEKTDQLSYHYLSVPFVMFISLEGLSVIVRHTKLLFYFDHDWKFVLVLKNFDTFSHLFAGIMRDAFLKQIIDRKLLMVSEPAQNSRINFA